MSGKGLKPLAGIRSQHDTMRNERAVAKEGNFGAVHLGPGTSSVRQSTVSLLRAAEV